MDLWKQQPFSREQLKNFAHEGRQLDVLKLTVNNAEILLPLSVESHIIFDVNVGNELMLESNQYCANYLTNHDTAQRTLYVAVINYSGTESESQSIANLLCYLRKVHFGGYSRILTRLLFHTSLNQPSIQNLWILGRCELDVAFIMWQQFYYLEQLELEVTEHVHLEPYNFLQLILGYCSELRVLSVVVKKTIELQQHLSLAFNTVPNLVDFSWIDHNSANNYFSHQGEHTIMHIAEKSPQLRNLTILFTHHEVILNYSMNPQRITTLIAKETLNFFSVTNFTFYKAYDEPRKMFDGYVSTYFGIAAAGTVLSFQRYIEAQIIYVLQFVATALPVVCLTFSDCDATANLITYIRDTFGLLTNLTLRNCYFAAFSVVYGLFSGIAAEYIEAATPATAPWLHSLVDSSLTTHTSEITATLPLHVAGHVMYVTMSIYVPTVMHHGIQPFVVEFWRVVRFCQTIMCLELDSELCSQLLACLHPFLQCHRLALKNSESLQNDDLNCFDIQVLSQLTLTTVSFVNCSSITSDRFALFFTQCMNITDLRLERIAMNNDTCASLANANYQHGLRYLDIRHVGSITTDGIMVILATRHELVNFYVEGIIDQEDHEMKALIGSYNVACNKLF